MQSLESQDQEHAASGQSRRKTFMKSHMQSLQGTSNSAATRLATIRGRQRHAEVVVAEDLQHLPELR